MVSDKLIKITSVSLLGIGLLFIAAITQIDYNTQIKNQPVLTVTGAPYNAKGNGTADDTVAIQAAVTAVCALGNVTLVWPHGIYSMTHGITVTGCNDVIFDGQGSKLFVPNDIVDTSYLASWPTFGKDSFFRILNSNNITIQNFNMDQNLPNRTAHIGGESANSCLLIAGSNNVYIQHNILKNCMTDGVLIVKDGSAVTNTNIWITNNTIPAARRNGISVVAATHWRILSNIISLTGTIQGTLPKSGIDVEPDQVAFDTTDGLIDANTFTSDAGNGILVTGLASKDLGISHNHVSNEAAAGIRLDDTGVGSVGVNVLVGPGNIVREDTTDGMLIRGQMANSIWGNTLCDNGSEGLSLWEVKNILVSNNEVCRNLQGGIGVGSVTWGFNFKSAILQNNNIHDNGSAQAIIDGVSFGIDAYSTDATSILILYSNTLQGASGTFQRGSRMYGGTAIATEYATNIGVENGNVTWAGNWLHNLLNSVLINDPQYITLLAIRNGISQAAYNLQELQSVNGTVGVANRVIANGYIDQRYYRLSDSVQMGHISYNGSGASGFQNFGIMSDGADSFVLGTANNVPVTFYTNSLIRGSILGNGHWLIGTATDSGAIIYRCLTAGTLAAGTLTSVSTGCGTSVDTGLRTP
jgi:hypothetical protein